MSAIESIVFGCSFNTFVYSFLFYVSAVTKGIPCVFLSRDISLAVNYSLCHAAKGNGILQGVVFFCQELFHFFHYLSPLKKKRERERKPTFCLRSGCDDILSAQYRRINIPRANTTLLNADREDCVRASIRCLYRG